MSKTIIDWFKKYTATSVEINNKFTKIMLIYVGIVLILFKLANLYITYELGMNIDDYVLVYNHIKNISKNSLIIIGLQNKIFIKNPLNIKNNSIYCFNQINKSLSNQILIVNQLHININSCKFSTSCINQINNEDTIKQSLLNININTLNSNKYPLRDMKALYSFGLKNPDIINQDPKYKEIMSILSDRILSLKNIAKIKFEDGYIEVGEFRNILLLEDNIENLNNINQDIALNEEYGIYDMLKYKNEFEKILFSLNENRVYKMVLKFSLNTLNYNGKEDREFKISPSFFITKKSSIDFLLIKFTNSLNEVLIKYDIPDFTNMSIFIKEWIEASELSKVSELYSILNKKEEEILSKLNQKDVETDLNEKFKKLFEDKKRNLSGFTNTRINRPSLLAKGLNYGWEILSKSEKLKYKTLLSNIESTKTNNSEDSSTQLLVTKYYKLSYGSLSKEKYYILQVSTIDNINNHVTSFIEIKENEVIRLEKVEEWIDIIEHNFANCCIRKLIPSSQEISFVNGEIEKIELQYNCKSLQESTLDLDKNLKIGSFDIETYLDKNKNVIPYYIGCRTGNKKSFYKYSDFANYDEMVLKFIENLMVTENHNRFYYALNMSNFDGIIVLKSLIKTSHKHDFKIKTLSKNDGTILSVVIKKQLINKKIIKITLADSFHLLPFSLMNLSKVFHNKGNIDLIKGSYPHDFINHLGINNGLLYKGEVPDIKYFNNISIENYNEIANNIDKYKNGIWDSEKELLDYLTKDIDILYDIMVKFGIIIYDYFNVNITRVRTYSGLSFLIYCSKYYNSKKHPIYLTSGKIDRYIRNGYYGGIVENFITYLDKPAYKYDINSHYPNQMRLNPMPGGKPKFSTETNLDKIFGFVRAAIIAPPEDKLKIPILPTIKDGKLVTFRGNVEGTWFSEELKYAKTLGYEIKVKDCIIFDKVFGLFDDFVIDIFKLKSQAELEKNSVLRLIFKLILNSLSGRWGLKDLAQEYKIVDNSKLNNLNKTENIDILFSSDKLSFVKSQGPVYPEIVDLFEKEKLIVKEENKLNEPKAWGRNVSAVQISAAITSYGRIYLNQFKNLPNNNYLGGDTDSFILEHPLDPSLVGPGLGQAKLEYIIKEGFFHSKKSYLIITDKNETIIKMKGIQNENSIVNLDTFVKLFKGQDVKISQLQFSKDYNNMNVKIQPLIKTIKGITDKEVIKYFKDKYK